jgi:aryl-alcohol dehydrogenase-like predicted oxidoreductase
MIKTRRLGASNLRVSELCLGTMMFGEQSSLEQARSIVASAFDKGVNFIDTADIYNAGRSETVVGQLIKPQRYDWVLATKLGSYIDKKPNHGHYSRQWIMHQVDQSLKRLDTDYIDILYLHRDFPGSSLEEALRAMDDLIRAGKLRSYGLSNFRGWRISEVIRLCDQAGAYRPVVCQPYYNLLNREPEVEIIPACAHHGLGVVPYSPIARGVLTGKYRPGQTPPPGSRVDRGDKRILATEFRDESLVVAETLKQHCDKKGMALSHFAAAWVLANPYVSSVIAGPRTPEQMLDYFPALDVNVTDEEEALVDSLVAPGHGSTPGYTDPAYPFYGRKILPRD